MVGIQYDSPPINPRTKQVQTEDCEVMKMKVKDTLFSSLVWASYRRNFKEDLLSDSYSLKFLRAFGNYQTATQEKFNTDMNWGCTLRVGQMLITNTLLRHLLIDDREFTFKNKAQFERFDIGQRTSTSFIKPNKRLREIYLNVIA
jgi:hypothetical protein